VNATRGRVAMTLVAVLLGFLVVLQIRNQDPGAQLSNASTEELTVIVANLSDRNDQLRTEVATLEREVSDLDAAKARGGSSLDELTRDLAKLRDWSGLDPVAGPGIQVTVAGAIDGDGVMALVNELRDAGAEALSADGIRLVAASVVAGPASGLSVEDHLLPSPFVLEAIGSSDTLTGALKRQGGIVAQLAVTYPEATITVTPVDRLLLAATGRDLQPAHGTPRL